jgi:hypothetical protein
VLGERTREIEVVAVERVREGQQKGIQMEEDEKENG